MVVVVVDDGTARGPPPRVACHRHVAAVGQLDVELQQQAGAVAVRFAVIGGRRNVRFGRVPAVAEHHAQRVGAGTQQVGQVVGHVQDTGAERERLIVVVVAGGRVQNVVADLRAVAGELVAAQAGEVAAGAAHRRGKGELAPQQGGGHSLLPGDPAAAPLVTGQEPRLEAGRSAEGGGRSALVPAAHAPEAARGGRQRRAAVAGRSVAAVHPAGVEQIRGARHQPAGRARDQHLVRGLPCAALRRPPRPGEPRRRLVDAERIDRVAAAEIGGGHNAQGCAGRTTGRTRVAPRSTCRRVPGCT